MDIQVTDWRYKVLWLGGLPLADRKAACADQKTVLSCLYIFHYFCLQLPPSLSFCCMCFLGGKSNGLYYTLPLANS